MIFRSGFNHLESEIDKKLTLNFEAYQTKINKFVKIKIELKFKSLQFLKTFVYNMQLKEFLHSFDLLLTVYTLYQTNKGYCYN